MNDLSIYRLVGLLVVAGIPCTMLAQEVPTGKGMTDANREYLVLDDMEDVSDWYNGSPEETKISSTDKHVKQGKHSLLFANTVDHLKGEKNYPVGWPRMGKNLGKQGPTDWSAYDLLEFWIYAETSRPNLPHTPLGLGIRHPGHKRSSDFRLSEVTKDAWVRISIPIAKLADPKDVQSIQFHIAEANYKHADRVDFYISPMTLVRFVEPAVADLNVDRKILYTSDRAVTATYRLVGYQGLAETKAELEIGREAAVVGKASLAAAREGEITLVLPTTLAPGTYRVRLSLRDPSGKLIDRNQTEIRVIAGPF